MSCVYTVSMTTYKKPLIWGFLFGTLGLYVLAFFALMLPFVETLTNFLYAPGRFLASQFAGPDGSTLEVILLMLANGILYAAVFALISKLRRSMR